MSEDNRGYFKRLNELNFDERGVFNEFYTDDEIEAYLVESRIDEQEIKEVNFDR